MPKVHKNPSDYTVNYLASQNRRITEQSHVRASGMQAAHHPSLAIPAAAGGAQEWYVPSLVTTETYGGRSVTDSLGTYYQVASVEGFAVGDLIIGVDSGLGGAHSTPGWNYTASWVTIVDAVNSRLYYNPPTIVANFHLVLSGFSWATTGNGFIIKPPQVTTVVAPGQDLDGNPLDTTVNVSVATSIEFPTTQVNVIGLMVAFRTGYAGQGFSTLPSGTPTSDYFNALDTRQTDEQMLVMFNVANGVPGGTGGWSAPPTYQLQHSYLMTLAQGTSPWQTTIVDPAASGTPYAGSISEIPAGMSTTENTLTSVVVGVAGIDGEEMCFAEFVPPALGGPSASLNTTLAHPAGSPVRAVTADGPEKWTFFPLYWVSDPTAAITIGSGQITVDPR